jgi:hypothetical protein
MTTERGSSDVITYLLLVGAVIPISIAIGAWSCGNRWADSGMKSRWQFGAGCQVQRKNGTWVPEKMLRDISAGDQ